MTSKRGESQTVLQNLTQLILHGAEINGLLILKVSVILRITKKLI